MLLNCTVDTLELKGVLKNYNTIDLSRNWITGTRNPRYLRTHISKLSPNIFLFVGLSNISSRNLDFKIKFGSVALNTLDINQALHTIPFQNLTVSLVDIALDYSTLKMSENLFTIFKKSKQIINNNAEILKNVERGYKFFKGDIVTGFVWGDRNRLYVRAYDKIEEIKENKNYIKEVFIQSYNSENVFRVEFSVRGKFKDYDLHIYEQNIKNLTEPFFYLPNIIDYIDKKVEANFYGKKVLNDLKNFSKIKKYQMSKKLRVSVNDQIQLNQGIGNIKSYLLKKYPNDKEAYNKFITNFNFYLKKQDEDYDNFD